MKKSCAIAVIFIMLLPVSVLAEKVVFVSPENIPPKIYKESGQLMGTYVDIIREVCKRLDIDPEFRLYPWKRAVKNVKEGRADAIFPPFQTEKRTEFLYFPSEPMTATRTVIFARKESGVKISGLDDLRGKIVSVVAGYSYSPEFDRLGELKKKECYIGVEQQVRTLHKGRMDVAVAAERPFRFFAKKLGLGEFFKVVFVLSEENSYVAFSKAKGLKSKLLAEKFGQTLSQLKKEGVIKRIEDKYFK